MHLSSSSVALGIGLMLAGADSVFAGSRLWEAHAPNPRTNPEPSYAVNLNSTSALVRRAISIKNTPNDQTQNRIWPNKKIRYCFEDRDDPDHVVRGLWNLARQSWAELETTHGFSYQEVDDSTCVSDRANVLRIHYNAEGRLSSSLGIPPANPQWDEAHPEDPSEGPVTHLSNAAGIGQDNIQANVAHELGHVWGLHHEHQNRNWWKTSSEHFGDATWGATFSPREVHFQTNGFDCTALKDHADALRRATEAAAEDPAKVNDPVRICTSRQAASDYGFSASEWLPLAHLGNVDADTDFDTQSLMMYPSGAGGIGLGDNRRVVMRFADGSIIPNRIAPSTMDIQRLVTLYGSSSSSTPGEVHITSGKKSVFKRLRSKFSSLNLRAGHTREGIC